MQGLFRIRHYQVSLERQAEQARRRQPPGRPV